LRGCGLMRAPPPVDTSAGHTSSVAHIGHLGWVTRRMTHPGEFGHGAQIASAVAPRFEPLEVAECVVTEVWPMCSRYPRSLGRPRCSRCVVADVWPRCVVADEWPRCVVANVWPRCPGWPIRLRVEAFVYAMAQILTSVHTSVTTQPRSHLGHDTHPEGDTSATPRPLGPSPNRP